MHTIPNVKHVQNYVLRANLMKLKINLFVTLVMKASLLSIRLVGDVSVLTMPIIGSN